MRKSKIFDASGKSVVFSGKKSGSSRKTNTNNETGAGDKRKSSEISTPISYSGVDCDHESNSGSKSLARRPTFKEFEGKFLRNNRLVKSQSLDHEPKGFSLPQRPPTPGAPAAVTNKEKLSSSGSGVGMKKFSRRAREVFLNNNSSSKSDEKCLTDVKVISSNKPTSLMSRLFQR